ncbi:hypothetical protein FRC00_009157 [Tulasnella sp. 408]|nr:hypothetical protein FRC00_009157 [Tulasnella sp. 408]
MNLQTAWTARLQALPTRRGRAPTRQTVDLSSPPPKRVDTKRTPERRRTFHGTYNDDDDGHSSWPDDHEAPPTVPQADIIGQLHNVSNFDHAAEHAAQVAHAYANPRQGLQQKRSDRMNLGTADELRRQAQELDRYHLKPVAVSTLKSYAYSLSLFKLFLDKQGLGYYLVPKDGIFPPTYILKSFMDTMARTYRTAKGERLASTTLVQYCSNVVIALSRLKEQVFPSDTLGQLNVYCKCLRGDETISLKTTRKQLPLMDRFDAMQQVQCLASGEFWKSTSTGPRANYERIAMMAAITVIHMTGHRPGALFRSAHIANTPGHRQGLCWGDLDIQRMSRDNLGWCFHGRIVFRAIKMHRYNDAEQYVTAESVDNYMATLHNPRLISADAILHLIVLGAYAGVWEGHDSLDSIFSDSPVAARDLKVKTEWLDRPVFARCDKDGKPTDEMWSVQYATNLFQDLLAFMGYNVCFDGENKLTYYCYRKNYGSALKQNSDLHEADRLYLMTHVHSSHEMANTYDGATHVQNQKLMFGPSEANDEEFAKYRSASNQRVPRSAALAPSVPETSNRLAAPARALPQISNVLTTLSFTPALPSSDARRSIKDPKLASLVKEREELAAALNAQGCPQRLAFPMFFDNASFMVESGIPLELREILVKLYDVTQKIKRLSRTAPAATTEVSGPVMIDARGHQISDHAGSSNNTPTGLDPDAIGPRGDDAEALDTSDDSGLANWNIRQLFRVLALAPTDAQLKGGGKFYRENIPFFLDDLAAMDQPASAGDQAVQKLVGEDGSGGADDDGDDDGEVSGEAALLELQGVVGLVESEDNAKCSENGFQFTNDLPAYLVPTIHGPPEEQQHTRLMYGRGIHQLPWTTPSVASRRCPHDDCADLDPFKDATKFSRHVHLHHINPELKAEYKKRLTGCPFCIMYIIQNSPDVEKPDEILKAPTILSHVKRSEWEEIISGGEWPRQKWKRRIFKSGKYRNLVAQKSPKDKLDDEEEPATDGEDGEDGEDEEDEEDDFDDSWIEKDCEYDDSADVSSDEEEGGEEECRKVRLISHRRNGRNMAQSYLYPGFGNDNYHSHLWRHFLAQGGVCAFGCELEEGCSSDTFLLHLEEKHAIRLDFGVNLGIIKRCCGTNLLTHTEADDHATSEHAQAVGEEPINPKREMVVGLNSFDGGRMCFYCVNNPDLPPRVRYFAWTNSSYILHIRKHIEDEGEQPDGTWRCFTLCPTEEEFAKQEDLELHMVAAHGIAVRTGLEVWMGQLMSKEDKQRELERVKTLEQELKAQNNNNASKPGKRKGKGRGAS